MTGAETARAIGGPLYVLLAGVSEGAVGCETEVWCCLTFASPLGTSPQWLCVLRRPHGFTSHLRLAVCINKGLNQRHLELVFYLA